MAERTFDVVVIGAGPAIEVPAGRLVAREHQHVATIAVAGVVPMRAPLGSVTPLPTPGEIWLKLLERYEAGRRVDALVPAA